MHSIPVDSAFSWRRGRSILLRSAVLSLLLAFSASQAEQAAETGQTGTAGATGAADLEAGKKAFIKCQVCHSVEKDVSKIGPSLHGVFGRKAGTLASFPGYSDPMKASGITWDEKTIAEFLKNPRTYIPKTKMLFIGTKDDAEISNLLAYLKSVQ